PKRRETEKDVDQREHRQRHADGAHFVRRDIAGAEPRRFRKRTLEALDGIGEEPAGRWMTTNRRMKTMTTVSTGAPSKRRMTSRSIAAPRTKERTTVRKNATQ